MPPWDRLSLPVTLALAAGVIAACAGPGAPTTPGASRKPAAASPTPGHRASATPGPGASSVATPLPGASSATATPPAAPDGALSGVVLLPTSLARLITDNGGGLITDNGGGLITDNGGGLISNNGGSVVANHGAGYRLLAVAARPLPNAEVDLLDAAGVPLKDAQGAPLTARTDALGRFAFTSVPAGSAVVAVPLGAAGSLTAIAPKDRAAKLQLDLDLVHTLASGYILDQYVRGQANPAGVLDRLPNDVELQTLGVLGASLDAAKAAAPAALTVPQLVGLVESLRRDDKGLDGQLEAVKKLLVVGGVAAQTDGAALSAALGLPRGLALDTDGTLYMANALDNTVRAYTPDGQVKTIAGSGLAQNVDGAGLSAGLNIPRELALDGLGHLYVSCADSQLRTIDLHDPTHPVTTLAGKVGWGYADGPAALARFAQPMGLAVDRRDPLHPVLYVADHQGLRVRAVALTDPAQTVTTVAGTGAYGQSDGPGASAAFADPGALAVTADGRLLLAESATRRLRLISLVDPSHPVTTLRDATGVASLAAQGLAVAPDGTVVFTDASSRVRRVDLASGAITLLAGINHTNGGDFADGPGADARFRGPEGVAIDATGRIFVADTYNHRIRAIAADAAHTVSTIAGRAEPEANDGDGTSALFNRPRGVVVGPDGTFYVADTFNHTIRQVTPEGRVTTLAGSGTPAFADGAGASASFWYPAGLAYDGRDPLHPGLFIADVNNGRVRRLDLVDPGHPVTTVADGFEQPSGLALDQAGFLYVSDAKAGTISTVDPTSHAVTLFAGTGGSGFNNGAALKATFREPRGLALVGSTLYVADAAAHRIRAIDLASANHAVTTFAGQPEPAGQADGPAATATFGQPFGLAYDPAGRLLVGDDLNNLVRAIDLADPAHAVTTVSDPNDPTPFAHPDALAVDAEGTVYVADSVNNRIRLLRP